MSTDFEGQQAWRDSVIRLFQRMEIDGLVTSQFTLSILLTTVEKPAGRRLSDDNLRLLELADSLTDVTFYPGKYKDSGYVTFKAKYDWLTLYCTCYEPTAVGTFTKPVDPPATEFIFGINQPDVLPLPSWAENALTPDGDTDD